MNIVAAIFADFESTFLGGPSRLCEPLGTHRVLEHTLRRLARVTGLERRLIFVRPQHADAAAAAVQRAAAAAPFDLLPTDRGDRPRRALFRAARKWNLESWRGGPLTSTWFDEYVDPVAVAAVLEQTGAAGVLCIDGHQAALDVEIASAMIAQQVRSGGEARFTFSPAPPGIAGIVLTRAAVRELLEQRTPVGVALGYRPEIPQGDPLTRAGCLHVGAAISQTAARLVADTRRSCELLQAAFRELGPACHAAELCAWLRVPGRERAGPLPIEVELELTTDDPLPDTTLRPRGARVPRRQLTDLAALARLADELGAYDDRLVYLGGFGDPLLFAELGRVLRLLRDGGVAGIAVGTTLVELSDAAFDALFEYGVDILHVRIDATTPETFARVHGAAAFAPVMANLERIESARRDRAQPAPIVVPSLVRCAATIAEQEAFFDGWIRRSGSAAIEGYNDFGGLLPPDGLISLEPPIRTGCRRLAGRLMLLADGTVARCGQDYGGSQPLGNWHSEPLTDIWAGRRLAALRDAHSGLALDATCRACHEWHRP